MDRPISRELSPALIARLRALLESRGLRLATNPKNRYVAFEVRTAGRSIFTQYTSGKLVSTVRPDDAEGVLLGADIDALVGPAPAAAAAVAARAQSSTEGLRWLAGADETGTGELLGRAVVAGALLPAALVPQVTDVAGHVETKSSRAASGWEQLGEQLVDLAGAGLVTVALPVSNRLFDAWSKNGLLDLAYVRVVGDLLAAAWLTDASLDGLELAIDDYGTGVLLASAAAAWRQRGARVLIEHKADVHHIAARTASIVARSARSREWEGLAASVEDGPLGTGNAGNPGTVAWVRRRARAGLGWPSFVKASFKTVRQASGEAEATKRRVPPLLELLDEQSAADFLAGRLDVTQARLLASNGRMLRQFAVDEHGTLLDASASCAAWELLPLLVGGLVLDPRLTARAGLERLDALLDRETGLLADWRVLIGPDEDGDDPALLALARAHRLGAITVVRTDERDPAERAARRAAALLGPGAASGTLRIELPA